MRKFAASIFWAMLFLVALDCMLVVVQSSSLKREVGRADFLAAMGARISNGLHRQEVERRLIGYRQVEEYTDEGEITVEYNYWFGFLPPVGPLRFKIAGGFVVTYSADGRVIGSSFWYN